MRVQSQCPSWLPQLPIPLGDRIMEVAWNVSAVDVSVTSDETTVLQPSYLYEFSMTVSIRVPSNPGALMTSDETTVGQASYVYESPITVSIKVPSTPLAFFSIVVVILVMMVLFVVVAVAIVVFVIVVSRLIVNYKYQYQYSRKIMNNATSLLQPLAAAAILLLRPSSLAQCRFDSNALLVCVL
jgi:hypothetical protein